MLFKKLLSITLAAAMSASMLSAAPTITSTSVAVAADTAQEAYMAKCMLCHKEVPKSEIHIASNGCSACYDCYPAASCCFPTITTSTSGIITAIDNDSLTLDKTGKFFFNAPLELQHLTNKLGHKPKVGEKLNMEYTYLDNPEHTDDHYIITFKSASTENDSAVTVEDNEVHGIAGVFDHAEDGYLYFINNEKYPYGESLAAAVNSLSKGNIINVTLSSSDTIISVEKTIEGTTTATSVQTSITTTTTCINTTLPATTTYWKQYALSLIPPEKTEYNIGEELDFTGGSAYGTVYDSLGMLGDTFPQPIDSKYFKVDSSEFDNTKPGTYTIYVTYGEGEGMAKQSFKVTVRGAVTSQPVTTATITTTLTAPVTSVKEYDRTSFRGTFDSYVDCGSYKELYLSSGIKYTLSSLRFEGGLSDEKEVLENDKIQLNADVSRLNDDVAKLTKDVETANKEKADFKSLLDETTTQLNGIYDAITKLAPPTDTIFASKNVVILKPGASETINVSKKYSGSFSITSSVNNKLITTQFGADNGWRTDGTIHTNSLTITAGNKAGQSVITFTTTVDSEQFQILVIVVE